jgi:hypothetical protein
MGEAGTTHRASFYFLEQKSRPVFFFGGKGKQELFDYDSPASAQHL